MCGCLSLRDYMEGAWLNVCGRVCRTIRQCCCRLLKVQARLRGRGGHGRNRGQVEHTWIRTQLGIWIVVYNMLHFCVLFYFLIIGTSQKIVFITMATTESHILHTTFGLHLFYCGLGFFHFIRWWRIKAQLEEKTRGLREVSLQRLPPWDGIRVTVKIVKNGKESRMNIKIQFSLYCAKHLLLIFFNGLQTYVARNYSWGSICGTYNGSRKGNYCFYEIIFKGFNP